MARVQKQVVISERYKKVVIPLATHDFDPSEVAVTWKLLKQQGHHIEFSTMDGQRAYADAIMLSGQGLDPWGFIPGLNKLILFGALLRANKFSRLCYAELETDSSFLKPIPYSQLQIDNYDGLILPGGHAPGMKSYLENKVLQNFIANFFDAAENKKAIGAICHGVVLAARSISNKTGKSVLHGRKTTALPWSMERSAWRLSKYLCRFWDSQYYRTYIESPSEQAGYRSVEAEVTRALQYESDFINVDKQITYAWQKSSGLFRDSKTSDKYAWVVKDKNYLSARWPGDANTFANEFHKLLQELKSS